MRLLYRADGGHPIGTGHIFRAARLINYLSADCPFSAVLVVSDNPAALRIAEAANAQIVRVPPSFSGDSVKPAFAFDSVRDVIEKSSFDISVIDMLDTDAEEMSLLAESGIPIVTFDDRGDGRTWARAVVNCLVTEPKLACLPGTIRLHEGFEYAVLGAVYAGANGTYRFRGGPVERVFVSVGGGDAAGLTLMVARALEKVHGIRRVEFGIGPAFPHARALEELRSSAPWDSEVYKSLPNLLERYLCCDLAVIGGGLTMYEACCVGVPALAVCQPIDHQAELSSRLAGAGGMATVGFGLQAGEERIAREIERLSRDIGARQGFSLKGPTIVDGRGIERVARIIRQIGGIH